MLSSRLKFLVDTGVLRRRDPERGRMSGYEFTQKGRDLGPAILAMKRWMDERWGDERCDAPGEAFEFVHDECGHVFVAEMTSRACGRPIRPGGVHIADGSAAPDDLSDSGRTTFAPWVI